MSAYPPRHQSIFFCNAILRSSLTQAGKFAIPSGATFHDIVVPTADTARNEHLIAALATHGHHVLLTGETGTGKSVTAKRKLLFGMDGNFSTIVLNFSAQTSANQVITVRHASANDGAISFLCSAKK